MCNLIFTQDHPNIIKMYQLFEDYNNFYIVSELCQGTELYDSIK
jgi:serine/threonine protein kinase